jgi:hypothetical protein
MTTDDNKVQNDAIKSLRDSIDSKINPDYKISIFDVLSKYVKSVHISKDDPYIYERDRYGALITGSAVTHALCTSIHNNGLHPDEVGWDFNDVDIIVRNPNKNMEPVVSLFNYLYKWTQSLCNKFNDECPIDMHYSKCNTYNTFDMWSSYVYNR